MQKYPTITFQSTMVEKKGGQYLVTGKLTMGLVVSDDVVLTINAEAAIQ